MSQSSLTEAQGHYRYNPANLKSAGPFRLFPYSGQVGTLKYILTELPHVLAHEGKLSQPSTLLVENLVRLSLNLKENWAKITTLLVDLEIFQSGWFNFNLPPDEQFNSDFVRLRRDMGKVLTTAKKAAKQAGEHASNHAHQQRMTFYQELEERGRARPTIVQIHERDSGLSDREFARQRLAGPNPMVIEQMRDAALLTAWQNTIDIPAHPERLFTLDYALLQLAPADMQPGRYVGVPQTLFYQGDQGLEPLLIQPTPGGKVFTPADGDAWMKAKLFVQVADVTHHELLAHLCYTHLAMEAFALATPRQLPVNHPLYRLLRPHFRFLLAINTRGNAILLGEGAAIDDMMAPTRAAAFAMMNKAYRQRPFGDYSLPRDMERRGLAGLTEFPYRDDAQLLWDAVSRYATAYLQRYYPNDQAVQQDTYLQNWAAELGMPLSGRSPDEFADAPNWLPKEVIAEVDLDLTELPNCHYPRVPNFPNATNPGKITTVTQLIDVATQLIFTCSAQHAAVNFSQFDYFGYVPNAPMAAYTQPDHEMTAVAELLPPPTQDLDQMELTFALSGIVWSRMGSSDIIHFTDAGDLQALQQLQADLKTIETQISDRNQHRHAAAGIDYPYLLPSRIPNSINI
jgi:arachidonate 15-lipoxygenase